MYGNVCSFRVNSKLFQLGILLLIFYHYLLFLIYQIGKNIFSPLHIYSIRVLNVSGHVYFYRAITEAGFNYSDVNVLANSVEVMLKLADCSPFKNVHKVQAPTLFLLGEKDLRVPPSQALAYHHLLKKHGVITK